MANHLQEQAGTELPQDNSILHDDLKIQENQPIAPNQADNNDFVPVEIGRASCRERV